MFIIFKPDGEIKKYCITPTQWTVNAKDPKVHKFNTPDEAMIYIQDEIGTIAAVGDSYYVQEHINATKH